MVNYDRQTVNAPNPLARFSHRARIKKAINLAAATVPPGGTVVDFGAGPGTFLSALCEVRPDIHAIAIEPYMQRSGDERISYISSFDELNSQVDLITSFEVSEHLSDEALEEMLNATYKCLGVDGKFILSVPIMIGLSILPKEINRSLLHRRRSEYSFFEILSALVGGKVSRPQDRLTTHKGFDFRILKKEISRKFNILDEFSYPFPLPWWINSQVFFVCSAKA